MSNYGVNLFEKNKVLYCYFFCINELANDWTCRSGHQGLMLTLKGPVSYIYGTHQCGLPRIHSFAPHWSRAPHWPALEQRLCPIAGRRKPRFNRKVSEPRLCQEPQAAFPVWVPRLQATGPRYTSRKSCVHKVMPYSTCVIGNLPMFS